MVGSFTMGAARVVAMLCQNLRLLEVTTSAEGFTDLTAALNREIAASGLDLGVATLVCQHTICSLSVQLTQNKLSLELDVQL
jgi:thiamine phosphate synthase YjbQ (UPF0047 family)